MKLLLVLLVLGSSLWAATVTHQTTFTNTNQNDAGPYTSSSFTPTAGDEIGVFVVATGTVGTGTMTDSQSLGMTNITHALKNGSADTTYFFVSNALAANTSTTVAVSFGGDSATSVVMFVFTVAGLTRTGSSAVLQFKVTAAGSGGGTPAATFAASALTGNPTVGVVGNGTNPAGITEPGSWTEKADTGIGTPATGGEYVSRDSGFTGTTITWGSTSASGFNVITAEFDTSAAPATARRLTLMGVG